MSERGVGAVEREALDRATACVIAQRRAYHARLEAIATLTDLGTAGTTGYRSTESLLADRDNLDPAEAKRLVAEAADLCARSSILGEPLPARLPTTGEALAAGVIDPAHVKIIRETMAYLDRLDRVPPDEWVGVERTLAEHAQALPPRLLRRLAKRLVDLYDPDGAAPPDGQDDFDELRLHRRRDGSLVFTGRLGDPMDAEMVLEVFGVLSAPAGSEDERGMVKRNADAFKDLVQDARGPRGLATDVRAGHDEPDRDGGSPAANAPSEGDGATDDDEASSHEPPDHAVDGSAEVGNEASRHDGDEAEDEVHGDAPLALIPEPRRPAPERGWTERPGRALLTVTIDHRWLCAALAGRGGYGTLDSGLAVDAATVRRWACDADIVPMILSSRSEPLDVGRAQRTAPDAIRRALNTRDGGCAFPGCDRAPRRCQAHHVQSWLDRGATAVHTMCLLCRYHHQLIHHGHWTIHMIDGRPWFTPPGFIDPAQRPRPGGRPHVPL
ncbi:DUF222 domain-containing protein [Actinomycetospora lutea]|uniref:HNH endonuclease signature motif containing protein n=1 Tax=Actinomycetospora lutea TaxID=663604 RepID=UPI00236609B0|nr:HNH endonuclease signature motif containing protein [Actinomycetospora lutea]MDD7939203.1 DUF222 domain-containing protein [Actinomycetospora lutea]